MLLIAAANNHLETAERSQGMSNSIDYLCVYLNHIEINQRTDSIYLLSRSSVSFCGNCFNIRSSIALMMGGRVEFFVLFIKSIYVGAATSGSVL